MALPQQIRVKASVVLASNRLRLRELLRLERGSVVPLAGDADALSNEAMDAVVAGVPWDPAASRIQPAS